MVSKRLDVAGDMLESSHSCERPRRKTQRVIGHGSLVKWVNKSWWLT